VARPSLLDVETDSEDLMHIDCDTCQVRPLACGDCVVTYLLGSAPDGVTGVEFDQQERAALAVLAASGLVPPLRLVAPQRTPGRRGGNAALTDGDPMKSAG